MKRLLPIMPLALAFSTIALGQLFPVTPAAGTTLPQAGLSVARDGGRTHMALNGVSFHETPDVISAARLIEVPQSTVCLVCWEQTAPDGQLTPYYAISLDGENMATVRPTSYELKLQHSQFDPLGRIPAVETDLAADEDSQIYIVQFVTQPLEQFRTAIEARGGTLYKYIANHAYLVKLGPQARQAVAALPFVRWLGPYHPAYRLEHFLRANRGDAGQLFPMQRYNILLFEREGAQDVVADRIAALGGEVNVRNAGRFLMQATLTPQQLFDVIRWDEVQFIDRWSPAEPDIDLIRADGGADYIETVAGYDGAGVRGEVIDVGFCPGHVDFASRPLIPHTSASIDTHGCSCSGIIFGDGTGDPTARGLCPAGQGIIADWGLIGSRYAHTAELLEDPYYAVFVTASVGGFLTTSYTTVSADMDDMLFDLDILHCNSQSNAGSRDSRPEAWAKNIVSCGGIYHYGTLDPADDCWCGGASIGPAADGRVKPDLVFYYDRIHTTSQAPAGYTDGFCCTSGATPTVAGHFGLFFQMWADGIFGNPVIPGATVFENRPHMTTAKAALINTANQYEFSGPSHDLGRMHQGWGRPSVANLYDVRNKIFVIDETELLQNLERYICQAFVAPEEPALKVTMTYADPAGVPGAAQARINDLTLKVVSPSGVEYWGNNGLLTGNWSTPGGAPDTINTVENVFVRNPEPGLWTVTVLANEINEDGHVETPELDADFALVISGTPGFALRLRLLDRPPAYLAPGEPTPVVLAIDEGSETYVPGSGALYYSYDGGAFQQTELLPVGDNLYQGILPAATCSATPRFYFSAAASGGGIVYSPPMAPEVPYSATVGVVVTAIADNFEQDLGWTVWNDPSLTGGMWQRGIPLSAGVGQPPTADYDGSGKCWLTQNVAGGSDVDGGPTCLISPLLDLTGQTDPVLQFARWWANDDQDGDPFDVEASSDGGTNWVLLRRIQNVQPEWVVETIHLADFIPPTDQVRLRFSVRDVPNNSVDEGGLDAVSIRGFNCTDGIDHGDLNCDGVVNVFDIDPFVLALTDAAAYGAAYPGCSILNADCNGDGSINVFDIDSFVQCLTSGC